MTLRKRHVSINFAHKRDDKESKRGGGGEEEERDTNMENLSSRIRR